MTEEMEVAREETFGPVVPIMRISSDEEALQIANSSPYGLLTAVWTRDLARGLRFAEAVDAGWVNVNESTNYWESHLPVRRPRGLELGRRPRRRQPGAGGVHRAEDGRAHAVTTSAYLRAANQPPPLEGYDLFSEDRALVEALDAEGGGRAGGRVRGVRPPLRRRAARARPARERAARPDARGATTRSSSTRPGTSCSGSASSTGCTRSRGWTPRPAPHVARAAKFMTLAYAEAGVGCPLSMTYAAVPALRGRPELAAEWEPRLAARDVRARAAPVVREGRRAHGDVAHRAPGRLGRAGERDAGRARRRRRTC